MTDKKISDLTAITGASTASDDLFVMVDSSEGVTKKITRAELNNALERDTFATVDIDSGTIAGVNIDGNITASANITFGDNNKAIFGAGSDLEIFHNGSNSKIVDAGVGVLELQTNGTEIQLTGNAGSDYMARFVSNADVKLYYDSALKLATTSTGVDVTGTVTADGLTVDASGTIQINASTSDDFLTVTQTSGEAIITADSTAGTGNLLLKTTAAGVDSNRMRISGGGDIAFYDSTGASQDLYWDASTSRLGLGTTAPNATLDIADAGAEIRINDSSSNPVLRFMESGTSKGKIETTAGDMRFYAGGVLAANRYMTIDSSGNLLVGYTSSNGSYKLQVNSQIFATSSTIATSDGRYKENIKSLSGSLDLVKQLNPVQFSWKSHPIHEFDTETPTVGFIAQEVQQVLSDKPYANSIIKINNCVLEPEEYDEEGNVTKEAVTEEFLGIAEGNMVALLTAALQEAITKIETLEQRITTLENA
jgi:hypothetical protein